MQLEAVNQKEHERKEINLFLLQKKNNPPSNLYSPQSLPQSTTMSKYTALANQNPSGIYLNKLALLQLLAFTCRMHFSSSSNCQCINDLSNLELTYGAIKSMRNLLYPNRATMFIFPIRQKQSLRGNPMNLLQSMSTLFHPCYFSFIMIRILPSPLPQLILRVCCHKFFNLKELGRKIWQMEKRKKGNELTVQNHFYSDLNYEKTKEVYMWSSWQQYLNSTKAQS